MPLAPVGVHRRRFNYPRLESRFISPTLGMLQREVDTTLTRYHGRSSLWVNSLLHLENRMQTDQPVPGHLEVDRDPPAARKQLYSVQTETMPDVASPSNHTMGRKNFLHYIGRLDPISSVPADGNQINSQKFSDAQKAMLQKAFYEGLLVRVIGAEKRDAAMLTSLEKRQLVSDLFWHRRQHKTFNCNRALMFFTRAQDSASATFDASVELWIVVFPSTQYVDQIGELIQAIFVDFERRKVSRRGNVPPPSVKVWHYPELEAAVSSWTDLEGSLSSYVRHGDVVVIGNVELLLPGIEAVGYQKKFQGWQRFGINEMFGIQILVNASSLSRLVLLGVTECYWGEASARYVDALVRAGARHILYGSKAASMTAREDIAGLRSPGSFSIYVRHRKNQGLTQLNSTLTDNEALKHLAELATIETVGIGVTVPTVIGEDFDQRRQLHNLNPSTMDDEDGHIASVVQQHNRTADSYGEHAAFLPVHFISDYIHKKGEGARRGQIHLGETDKATRDPAFSKIGSFFGVYATIYGLREYITIPQRMSVARISGTTVAGHMAAVRSLLNAGLMREAISSLTGSSRIHHLPSSNLQTITLICQKYGFVDDALNTLALVKHDASWTRISKEDRLRMLVVEAKLHTQVGRFSQAALDCARIRNMFDSDFIASCGHHGSLYRRIALAHAYEGRWTEAQAAFDTAKQKGDESTVHAEATNDVFYYIACLGPDCGSPSPTDWSEGLARAREHYLLAAERAPVWQANPEKSALTALFVEAALHLVSKGLDDLKGLSRLYIAHLLNIRVGGSERSEGYGELIAFIKDPELKGLFRRAMRMDGIGRSGFQKLPHTNHLLARTQACLDVFSSPLVERSARLKELLAQLDSDIGAH